MNAMPPGKPRPARGGKAPAPEPSQAGVRLTMDFDDDVPLDQLPDGGMDPKHFTAAGAMHGGDGAAGPQGPDRAGRDGGRTGADAPAVAVTPAVADAPAAGRAEHRHPAGAPPVAAGESAGTSGGSAGAVGAGRSGRSDAGMDDGRVNAVMDDGRTNAGVDAGRSDTGMDAGWSDTGMDAGRSARMAGGPGDGRGAGGAAFDHGHEDGPTIVGPRGGHGARPRAMAAASAGRVPGRISAITVTLSVELGRQQVALGDLMAGAPGQFFTLDRLTSEPVDIMVNGQLFARGEVVVIDDRFGVRLSELVDPEG